MANRLTKIEQLTVSAERQREENLQDVLDALADNKDAVLESIRFLSLLHKEGNLAMVNAMVAYQETIMGNVAFEANRGENGTILKNLSRLIKLLGMLNLDGIDQFANSLAREEMEEDEEFPEVENIGYIGMVKALKDPEVNRVISVFLHALKGVGSKAKK